MGALLLSGCTATMTGRVVSGTSGDPIAGAKVVVSGKAALTDSSGAFTIAGLGRGAARGSVAASGMPDTSFSVDLSKGDAVETIKVSDSTLMLRVSEAAVEVKPVTDCVAKLDNSAVPSGQSLKGLAPGRYSLTVEATNHLPYKVMIDLKPGENAVTATLTLTPVETYRRYIEASRYHRDEVSYTYIHPDERALLSLAKWKKWMAGDEIKSAVFGEVRTLPTWTSPVTKKAYSNVAETDRTIEQQVTDPKYSDYGVVYTDNVSQHWAMKDGVWYILHLKIP